MPSSKEYLEFVLEQMSGLQDVTWRAMMGEYVIYYRGTVIGGIYDNRFLVKPVRSAVACMPEVRYELPYSGGKEMLSVDEIDDREFVTGLIQTVYEELAGNKKNR